MFPEKRLSPHSIPQKTGPSPLTAIQSVGGSVSPPLGTRQGGGGVCRSLHGTGKEKGGVAGPSLLTDPREGVSVPLPSRTRRGEGGGWSHSPHGPRKKGKWVLVPLFSQSQRWGVPASFSPHRHREGLRVPLTSQTPRVGGSHHKPRGWLGWGSRVSLSPHGPRGDLSVPLLSHHPGPCPGGCPHRVPHEALEAEALLLGRAPGDDERLRLLAGPGRPRGRGRRHVPALAAPRPP